MIVLHHLNQSRSQRVLWLLEELGLPYEIRRYERNPETLRAPKALRDVHPLRSASRRSSPMAMSRSPNRGAILEYLAQRHGEGRLRPAAGRGGSRPRLMQFLDRIHQRPAYLRALERGGRFSIAA